MSQMVCLGEKALGEKTFDLPITLFAISYYLSVLFQFGSDDDGGRDGGRCVVCSILPFSLGFMSNAK